MTPAEELAAGDAGPEAMPAAARSPPPAAAAAPATWPAQDAAADAAEIVEYARHLGIDPIADADLMWVAEQAYVYDGGIPNQLVYGFYIQPVLKQDRF